MRKYAKPELYYESFELTQSIAGNCNVFESKREMAPGLDTEGIFNFLNKYYCTVSVDDPAINDSYCYTNAGALYVIFNS